MNNGTTLVKTPGPIPVRLDGRTVGVVVGREFRRTLRPEHVLRYPRESIAVSPEVLEAAERLGADVAVWTLPDGRTAVMGLAEFRAAAVLIDRGAGPQLAVPIARFFTARVEVATAAQLELFR